MCAPQSGPLRDVHGVIQRREERKETEVARRIKERIKRRDTDPASNQFLMCAPQSGPLRDVHGIIERREEVGSRQRWPGG